MKKLILSCILVPVACLFASDWGAFEQFKIAVNGYEVSYAFCECDIAMLAEQIPQAALDYVYGVSVDEEGNTTHNKTNVKLKDFTLRYWISLDGTKAIVLLAAREFDVGRILPVGLEQIQMWEQYLTPYGYTFDKWLTKSQALDKINGIEYNGESQP